MRVIKTFDSLPSKGAQFGGEVFPDISAEALYVFNRVDNEWYQSLHPQPEIKNGYLTVPDMAAAAPLFRKPSQPCWSDRSRHVSYC